MTCYLGIDVAQASLSVAVADGQQAAVYVGEFPNHPTGFEQLVATVNSRWPAQPVQVVVEATGGYEASLVETAHALGWRVSVVNPWRVRQWAKGQGRRTKTDRQDALLLARFAAATQPPAQDPLPEEVADLAELERRKEDLQSLLGSEQNRLRQARQRPRTPPSVLRSLERTIQVLQEELRQVEQAIEQHLTHQATLAQQRRLLLSVPGVGPKVASYLLVLLHRFCAYTAQQGDKKALTAYVGLDPVQQESGRTVAKRPTISKQGDKRARTLLYLGALGGIRGNNPLRTFYQALVARGKARKLALVAAARKLLTWAWAVFVQKTRFDPSRFAHAQT